MKNPWFALYVADYLAKTGHLTQGQHGAYLLLMLHYYATGTPIPASAVQVHTICRCTNDAERKSAQQVLQLFFYKEGDFYRHKRIDEELATRSELRTKRQNAASKRWDAKAIQVHMHMHTQSQSQEKQLATNKVIPVSLEPKSKAKPSLEEVEAYCLERGNAVDPRKFCDYYTANGWKVGRNPMKDWRAAVRTWEANQNGERGTSKAQERVSRNRAAILEGLGYSQNAGFGGPGTSPGGHAGRGSFVGGNVQERVAGDTGMGVPGTVEDGKILP